MQIENILFLPEEHSYNVADLLINMSDALITISSTSAMTAALQGIKVIVVGDCAYSNLFSNRIEVLDYIDPLTFEGRASLIQFLCNKYSHHRDDILNSDNYFLNIISELELCADYKKNYLNINSFDLQRIEYFK